MIGIGVTAIGLVLMLMLVLGWANHTLGERLDSGATEGEGAQNYLCGAQAAGVLGGLAVTGLWPGGWWIDPAVELTIAGIAVWQGIRSWRGHDCCC